jgi:hypothetical protein
MGPQISGESRYPPAAVDHVSCLGDARRIPIASPTEEKVINRRNGAWFALPRYSTAGPD